MSQDVAKGSPMKGDGDEQEAFDVRWLWDAVWASKRVAEYAERSGLSRRASQELAVVASELVTNAVKFAGTGTVRLRRVSEPVEGVEVSVEDRGPGIDDPALALLDGYTEGAMRTGDEDPRGRRGLGYGLAAAKRLSDQLEVQRKAGGGTRVVARKLRR